MGFLNRLAKTLNTPVMYTEYFYDPSNGDKAGVTKGLLVLKKWAEIKDWNKISPQMRAFLDRHNIG